MIYVVLLLFCWYVVLRFMWGEIFWVSKVVVFFICFEIFLRDFLIVLVIGREDMV